jgi:hypothetical protein
VKHAISASRACARKAYALDIDTPSAAMLEPGMLRCSNSGASGFKFLLKIFEVLEK